MFIDDRSLDGGWECFCASLTQDAHVRAYRLSRNFGQDAAITAGLAQARGQWAVVMDCDLQEAPEDIPRAVGGGRRGLRHGPHGSPRLAPLGRSAAGPAAPTAS